MKFTPLDITQQSFPGRLGGYDKRAVQDFLTQVGEATEELLRERQQHLSTIETLSRELDEKRAQEEDIRRVIVTAERLAHDMKEQAIRESEAMVAQAHAQVQDAQRTQEVRAAQLETEHQGRTSALEIAFRTRFTDLEREQHELTLSRERQHAERTALLEQQFSDRYLELQSRMTAARQEYTQFLNGYRALVSSFADLSQRHALPDDAPLPLPKQRRADEPDTDSAAPGRRQDAAIVDQRFV